MPFLSIKSETAEALKLLRLKDEDDDALVRRILELARCQMVLLGMKDMEAV